MKQLAKKMDLQFMVACFLFWLIGFGGFFMPAPAICANSVADEIISLNVTDRPLGEVLENISIAAGCQFSIDESWEDYPITVSFDNEPLYRGLKLIFRDINNAVIYGADRTVKIIIYDEGTPSGKAVGQSGQTKSSQENIQESQPSGEATAPQSEVEASEDSSDAENVEQPPEKISDSDSDSNAANDENQSAEKQAPADETESASDSSENAENNENNENKESNEETTEN